MRYRSLVGKEVIVPFVERHVPVIADEDVDPEFGTGALKVTPGHDPVDFDIGRRHGLDELAVIGQDGQMNDEAGELSGLTQDEAGERVLEWARERDLLEKQEPYRHAVGRCHRCKTRVEPLVLLQWWVEMKELVEPAIAAVHEERVRFTPERFARVCLDWLENIRPWCISRQIWWGHRIPVWYCSDGHVTVAEEVPTACAECGAGDLRQDDDVLDTWFSSALYPFATLGWPEKTPELARYYPGDVLTTARDIIFLWVARMIFAGDELLGDDPFHDVVIHSYLANPDGSRMGRTAGAAVEPEDVLEPYGADATRYGLLKVTSSQDPRFSFGSIEEGRKLGIKLWNVSRLILQNTGDAVPEPRPRALEERWILARLDDGRAELEDCLARFDFAAPDMHNRVHLWVGGVWAFDKKPAPLQGTMALNTSLNDPVFWLHHSNIDRIWALWEQMHGKQYQPVSGAKKGQNIGDTMWPYNTVGIDTRIRDLLDITNLGYTYAAP